MGKTAKVSGLNLWEVAVDYVEGYCPKRITLFVTTKKESVEEAISKTSKHLNKRSDVYPNAGIKSILHRGTIDE